MKADIITTGDEILIGHIIDTNATWIAKQLESLGVHVRQITSISDDKAHICNVLDSALKSSKIVVLTGGLGPTNDDVTKHALCDFFLDELVMNQEVFSNVKRLFAKNNRRINHLNKQQAMIPSKSIVLPNALGTAPGIFFDLNDKLVLSLPGVPYEMKGLMHQFLPIIKEKFNIPFVLHKTIILRGIVESHLAELVQDWERQLPAIIKLAYLPSKGYIRLRFTSRGLDKLLLEKITQEQIDKLQLVAGQYFCPFQQLRIELIIGELLKEKGFTIATAESCTGGNIAGRITSIPGSSAYFKGSVVAYSEEVKQDQLGVRAQTLANHHIVSEAVVKEMAQGVKERLNTDYAIATSGVAGPGGAEEGRPVGTVCVAIASPADLDTYTFHLKGNRNDVIEKAIENSLWALKETLEK